ncbi:transcriptional regulator, AraC family [Alkalispirochaeta americana]|uniref:Transcriptional regulator, AraC family n=1 Tax=Alkalispirochaeta americana TaxID=159291 RepID=A0A1N6SL39_9SPIO|nr:helix-turn-helix domain-containing protein [Alkalispirochaeta americana]SIQ41801.1 transcriptional regulator, AraC family [Alkalispirochaeta americana]
MKAYPGETSWHNSVVLQRWTYHTTSAGDVRIIPDGCRDLLYWMIPGKSPVWSISHLQDTIMGVTIPEGTRLAGYRLAPGADVSDRVLLELQGCPRDDPDESVSRILGLIRENHSVAEALSAVATMPASVAGAATLLGISPRTLERLLMRHTARPPVFWAQLVRVRTAARYLVAGEGCAEAALRAGYADQAHLSRSVRRWFGVSPRELVHRPDLVNQLCSPGYDAATGEQISTRYPSGSLT